VAIAIVKSLMVSMHREIRSLNAAAMVQNLIDGMVLSKILPQLPHMVALISARH
jgi:hypothetical protein